MADDVAEHTDGKYRVSRLDGTPMQEGEPVFVFRAQDKLLPRVLANYADWCEAEGSPAEHVQAVIAHRADIVTWQADHPEVVKVPD